MECVMQARPQISVEQTLGERYFELRHLTDQTSVITMRILGLQLCLWAPSEDPEMIHLCKTAITPETRCSTASTFSLYRSENIRELTVFD